MKRRSESYHCITSLRDHHYVISGLCHRFSLQSRTADDIGWVAWRPFSDLVYRIEKTADDIKPSTRARRPTSNRVSAFSQAAAVQRYGYMI